MKMKKCKFKGKQNSNNYNSGKQFLIKFAMNLKQKKRIVNNKVLTTDRKEKALNFWQKVNKNLNKFMKRMEMNLNPLKILILRLKKETGTGNQKSSHIQNLEISKCQDILDPIAWMDLQWLYIQFGTQSHSNNAH